MPCLALPFQGSQGCLSSYCNECGAAASEADRHFAFGLGNDDGDADDLLSNTSPTLTMEYLYEHVRVRYGPAGWSRDDACRAATGLPSLQRRPTQRAQDVAALRLLLLLPPSQTTCSPIHAEPIAPSNSSHRRRGRRRPQGPPSRACYYGYRRGSGRVETRCASPFSSLP